MGPGLLSAVVDNFSRSMSSRGTVPYQKGTQPVRMRISPQCSARTPIKYTFPENSWARLHADSLLTLLRHPSMVCHSVKVLAIVTFGLSLPPRLPLRNVRSSYHVRAHHSRKPSGRALERLFGRSSTCRQRGVIAVCDGGAGTIKENLNFWNSNLDHLVRIGI